jgi:hypothetical protein
MLEITHIFLSYFLHNITVKFRNNTVLFTIKLCYVNSQRSVNKRFNFIGLLGIWRQSDITTRLQFLWWRQELHDSPPGATRFFPIQVKHCSTKTIKLAYQYYKRWWKWCPCICTHSLYRLNTLNFTLWIYRTRCWLFWDETLVNFTVMNWLQNPVAKNNPASRDTWLQSINYSRRVLPKCKQLSNYGCWWFGDAGILCKASQWFLFCVLT